MTDAAVVGRLLREYHLRGVRPSGIRRLSGSVHGTSVTYHVDFAAGRRRGGARGVVPPDQHEHDGDRPWLLRAYRADGPVLAQFSGSAAETAIDWLVGRARTLACLADAGYPAPRPVPVRSGELVGVTGQWLTWAITFIDGSAIRPSADDLERLGGILGQLHGIEIPAWTDAAHEPGRAAWHPEAAVATTLARLDAVAPLLPADWRPMHAAFLETAQAVRRSAGRLPAGLVHGDAWPGTAISTPGGSIILIDWESTGLGLPVLDFGNTLAECHLDADSSPDRPQAWLVQPDERRIAAVAGGYSAVRTLTAAEREMLPDAVRFGAAFAGAIHLEAALTGGAAGPAMDARLARLRNRLSISDTVAELALRHLPRAGPAMP